MATVDPPLGSDASAPVAAHAGTKTGARVPPLVMLYLIAFFIPMEFSIGPLAMTPLRLYLLLVTPVLFVGLFSGQYGRLRLTDGLFCFYLLWVSVALAVNNPEMLVENAGSTSMEFLGGYLVARASIRDRDTFAGFCRALTVMVALTIFPVLIEQVTGTAILMALVDAIPGVNSVKDGDNMRMGLQRVQVVFDHPILYGLVCSTTIPLTYVALKDEMSDTRRLLRTGVVSLCTFLSLSSGALLAMLLHYFMIGWAWAFARTTKRWLILFVMIIAGYVTVDLLSNRTPIRVFLTYATFSAQTAYTRLYIFEWGMVNIWANPVFGLGFRDWVRPAFMGASIDNFWLLTAMRYGIPGFVSLALGYFLLIWTVGQKNFDGDVRMLRYRRGWVFTLLGLCFTLATVHVWSGPYSFFAFLLGAGIWFLEAEPETEEIGNQDGKTDPAGAPDAVPEGPVYARRWLSHTPDEALPPQGPYSRKFTKNARDAE